MAGPQETQAPFSLDVYANALLGYLLGAWLIDFLVEGTALETLGLFLNLLVAGIFFFLLPARRDPGRSSGRPGRVIAEVIAGAWSAAGVGALIVWMWFVRPNRVAHEGLNQAWQWNRFVFWGLIVVGLIIGGYFGLLRSGWTGSRGASPPPAEP